MLLSDFARSSSPTHRLPSVWLRSALWTLVVWAGLTPAIHRADAAEAQLPEIVDQWRYQIDTPPADGWFRPSFDDSNWPQGAGGFGIRSTPGARVGTEWTGREIWIRKHFDVSSGKIAKPALFIHHDDEAEIYLNGELVRTFERWTSHYIVVPLEAAQVASLKPGDNLLAVHCHQDAGGQFIDVHLIDVDHVPTLPFPPRNFRPSESALITRWGEALDPTDVWAEYPRPQLVRERWTNLNGKWQYAITPNTVTAAPETWDGEILVPFCLESKLGGVRRFLEPDDALWYRRTFQVIPKPGRRVWLNFEAVDYDSRVSVNGHEVGQHRGGNDPFSFDITAAVRPGDNELIVRVEDRTEAWQLNGKQRLNPEGIFYTQVSGIWQTVWLEETGESAITAVKLETTPNGLVNALVSTIGPTAPKLQVRIRDGQVLVGENTSSPAVVPVVVPKAKLWSPDKPQLYSVELTLLDNAGKELDRVSSYVGFREVGTHQDAMGQLRMTLNGRPVFHLGPLDQGWWPDGLLTPPSDAAMLSDIEYLRAAGFNMIRKHIKVEPRRYYYHCDRLGMLVWQDQVSGGQSPRWTTLEPNPTDAIWPDNEHDQFLLEFDRMISNLQNHPSIVIWTPFNEAWGQHRTTEVGEWALRRDPSRLVNIASGGNFWPVGAIVDQHSYPHPSFPFDELRYKDFVKVVGEFGGHGFPIRDHLWNPERNNWGYGDLPKTIEEYKQRYVRSMEILGELRQKGIAAGVYTQTTDVEGEVNGLLTYDRRVQKIPADELRAIHARTLGPLD